MSRHLVAVVALTLASVTACSSQQDVVNEGNGICEQHTTRKFLWVIPYSSTENVINCDDAEYGG